MCSLQIKNEIESLRKGMSEFENSQGKTGNMDQQYRYAHSSKVRSTRAASKNMNSENSAQRLHPKLKGHVSVEKPDGKFDSMDMKVHLKLKSNKKPRSHSLSRKESIQQIQQPSKNIDRPQQCLSSDKGVSHRECHSKRWSDILKNNDKVPPVTRKSRSRHRSASPERISPRINNADVKFQFEGGNSAANLKKREDNQTSSVKVLEDLNAFSLFNPVRTLQFLISELRNSIKPQGDRVGSILALAEQLLAQIPQDSPAPQLIAARPQADTPRTGQLSRASYEMMRKERDTLQQQLSEKTRSHVSLERKVATLEAKLTRVRAEREELRTASQGLVTEQRALLASLQARGEASQPQASAQLQEELAAAHEYIARLQASTRLTEQQYRSKMKVVQDILHDGFDFSKNDSVRLSEVLGQLPDEPSAFAAGPQNMNAAPKPPVLPSALEAPTPTAHFSIEQYINSLMQQSGLVKEEQLSLFQSFLSIPEISPDKQTDSQS